MPCPHCGEKSIDNIIRSNAQINMESYGRSVLISTLCCQKPVRVYPVVHFNMTQVPHVIDNADDWGVPFKKD